MRRELMVVIFGGDQIRAGQKRRAPVAGGILEAVGGGHDEGSVQRLSVARRKRYRAIRQRIGRSRFAVGKRLT
jgi:hypothetical protein